MKKKNISKLFGEEKELTEICNRLSDPNYQGGSIILPKNASLLEKSKYKLCQKILIHQQKKNLPTEKLAKQIQLSIPETEDIFHYRINNFTLDRLIDYAEKLAIPLQITENSAKSENNILIPRKTSNGRLKKHV